MAPGSAPTAAPAAPSSIRLLAALSPKCPTRTRATWTAPFARRTTRFSSGAKSRWWTVCRCCIASRRCSKNIRAIWPPRSRAKTARPRMTPRPKCAAPFRCLEIGWIRQVAVPHLHVGTVLEARPQLREVLRIDVSRDVAFAPRREDAGQVADARSGLQHPLADVRLEGAGQPPIETLGAGERIEDIRSGIFVEISGEGKAQDYIDSFEGVLQPDLLAFFVSPAVIIDGRFVDAHASLGQFDGQFRLQSEAVAANRDALQQRSAEGFVAGLHVRKVQVRNDIAH